EPFPGVFIRAPFIEKIGNGVKVLAKFEDKIVAVRKDNILATAFHPELTDDERFHQYFIDMIRRE
ncbi:MAG: pyridoxal 5'-phosphate synthase glutaminase subunit PdxT, partial [Firmicutes bacterium]|nr:pyridoxal 5'-phosphate synthase glutaminase subunit PdxT [Bacillota bacterium]